jgi:hypothetical protein
MSCKLQTFLIKPIAAVFLLAGLTAPTLAGRTSTLRPVTSQDFCVTLGTLFDAPDQRMTVVDPQIRATLHRLTPQRIESHVRYFGPTKRVVPLGSGEIREQFGFKMRAQDPCNLVYVMWRFKTPDDAEHGKVVVQIKSNPGMHTSAECKNNGYRTIETAQQLSIPVPKEGEFHTLRASLNEQHLVVILDNDADDPVWEGDLDAASTTLAGPAGIRSDNVKLELKLFAPPPIDPDAPPLPCSAHGGD